MIVVKKILKNIKVKIKFDQDATINEKKVCDDCFEKYIKYKKTLNDTTVSRPVKNYIHDANFKTIPKRETTYAIYTKNVNFDSNECYNYLKLDKKNEEVIRKVLDSQTDSIIKNMIAISLKAEGLSEKWNEKAYELINNVITKVSPSKRDLDDSININDYVKIKTIHYHDHSLSKYINGYAFKKNVCSKKMKLKINEPKILLLEDCGKYLLSETYSSNSEVQNQSIDIILKKIEKVNPDIILVSSNVPYSIQEKLAINQKTLVMKVKVNAMTQIARITKTYILPSTDLVGTHTILGSCKKFYVNKIENKNKSEINTYNLMVFENHDSILGSTIVLSGPDELELQKVKRLFYSLILSARDIHLQKIYNYFSFYSPITLTNEPESKNKYIYNNKVNFSICETSKNTLFFKKDKENSDHFSSFNEGFDISFLNNQNNLDLIKLTFFQKEESDNSNPIHNESLGIDNLL